MDKPLWEPSEERIRDANVTRFIAHVNETYGAGLNSYDTLHAFSIDRQEEFWTAVWDFCSVRASVRGDRVIADGTRMPGAKYFPDARFNYAENLLRKRNDEVAIHFRAEDQVDAQALPAMEGAAAVVPPREGLGVGIEVAEVILQTPVEEVL